MADKSNIKEKNPFRVPDNYFSEVSAEIYSKTTGADRIRDKSRIIRLVKPALMLAAAMITFAVISYTVLRLLFPEYGNTVEENYTEILNQFDEVELINKLTEQEPDVGLHSAESDEIIKYLLDHDVEYKSIIEFLN